MHWKMVHQLNVIQIIKMDTPAVLLMDGVEIHRVIVHVAIALITVKVNFEKNLSWSHYREVAQWEILMEQELRFGLDLGRFGNFWGQFFHVFIGQKNF